ncbi:uncharacterized protein LOC131683758 [Topomyia yanbarensis]|uniref:uncharacterized protein LOC131683758 n=1 Tax=Topomyia yanbarensis TaxID=2498891 RepID=UPI00273AB771|nr:uncharacterized protein LOC131683758 [Topomyia yanbarensis]
MQRKNSKTMFVKVSVIMVMLVQLTGIGPRGVTAQYTGPTLACGGTSLLKTTTLISPAQIGTNGAATSCSYTIRAINLRVCQLRLDFNSFNLAAPTIDPYPICSIDTLSIQNLDFNLCGENSGQHVYVPFNPTLAEMTMAINFNLGTRLAGQAAPYWNIRVQQLECPIGASFASKLAIRTESTGLAKTFHNDLGVLAPTGCLQYHTAVTGVIKSFNFNMGGPYIGDMHYAICFRRLRTNTALKLYADVFDLASNDDVGIDDSCFSRIETIGRSEDYLYIPDGRAMPNGNTIRATRFCGQSIHQKSAETSAPGPFVLQFNSDTIYGANGARETGFHITYEIV